VTGHAEELECLVVSGIHAHSPANLRGDWRKDEPQGLAQIWTIWVSCGHQRTPGHADEQTFLLILSVATRSIQAEDLG